jgi:hypothetical protein
MARHLTSSAAVVAATLLLAACVSGPRVLALPGTGKTFEEFNADDGACRTWATQQGSSAVQWRYDIAYLQCMYARGHRVPSAGGSPGYAAPGPAPAPAGSPSVPPPPPGPPPPPPPGPAR